MTYEFVSKRDLPSFTHFAARPVTGALGAEIRGLSLGGDLPEPVIDELHRALLERSAGLDPITAAGLDELILKLRDVFKMTIVVVTHELPSVFKIADYVIMLDRGEVVFSGTLPEMQASDHPRVKMFLDRQPEQETYSPDDFFRFLAGN